MGMSPPRAVITDWSNAVANVARQRSRGIAPAHTVIADRSNAVASVAR
jgi:hypothetical protein